VIFDHENITLNIAAVIPMMKFVKPMAMNANETWVYFSLICYPA